MSQDYDLYIATSGPYRMAFVASQIDTATLCPVFPAGEAEQPGVLGMHEGARVVHPAWLWGEAEIRRPPQQLLVLRTGACALAVDTCRLLRSPVEPPPSALARNGVLFGLIMTAEGLTPVFDLACVPLG